MGHIKQLAIDAAESGIDIQGLSIEKVVLKLQGMDKNVTKVITDLQTRAAVGFKKYGTNTERTDLSADDWLQHLYEELLDAAVYINAYRATVSCNG